MIHLYDRTSIRCSREVTHAYSTSFSAGIRMFDRKFRAPIYSIYGFVRLADEIVDTFYDQDQEGLLERFRVDTMDAINRRFSLNPILNAFQVVVHQYEIGTDLIEAFLDSMEMDLSYSVFNREEYERYIYGSAEVVGLMCLKVFVEGDEGAYSRLLPFAKKLGSAFQKVNFLRDMQSDFEDRGRVYFPEVDFIRFTCADKMVIEREIEEEFVAALEGIRQLPRGARLGVYVAYRYYMRLLKRIKSCSADRIKNQRVRVPDLHKLILLSTSAMKYQLRVI